MISVLDAGAAIELVFKLTHHSRIAEELGQAATVLAPGLYVSEVANALWKYPKQASDPQEIDPILVDAAVELIDEFVPGRELYREAYAFSTQWGHPINDSMYLVLARRNAALLLTTDKRMRQLAAKNKIQVLSLK